MRRDPRSSNDMITLKERKLAYDPFKEAIKYKSVDDDVVDKMLEKYV